LGWIVARQKKGRMNFDSFLVGLDQLMSCQEVWEIDFEWRKNEENRTWREEKKSYFEKLEISVFLFLCCC